ncbi:Prolyl endopeptidase [Chelonia mydas]|uniref:Prolyl endopeptidase n=1 Tax=Chelonia mydas TaxID=8469 RepID=M7BA04_CHEMY|nr:Prolyl endopeptidase [Chelonia mydas]
MVGARSSEEGILQWVKLIDNFDGEYDYITNEGTVFTFKTNRHAPNYRLINIDFSDSDESKWKVLVPEHQRDVLEWVACVRSNFLVLCYLHDVKNVLQLHDLATGTHLKTFPLEVGSIVGYSGRKKDTEIFYQFTSFLSPGIIYHCDLTKEELEPRVFREVTVKGFDPSVYQTVQYFGFSAKHSSGTMLLPAPFTISGAEEEAQKAAHRQFRKRTGMGKVVRCDPWWASPPPVVPWCTVDSVQIIESSVGLSTDTRKPLWYQRSDCPCNPRGFHSKSRQEFAALLEEGKNVTRTSLQATLDAADVAARTVASAVTMKWCSWLQSSGLPHEVQQSIQDLPFEGSLLFLEQKDMRLHSLKDSRSTLRSLGRYTLSASRKHFRPQQPPYFSAPPLGKESYKREGRSYKWCQPLPSTSTSQSESDKYSGGPEQAF